MTSGEDIPRKIDRGRLMLHPNQAVELEGIENLWEVRPPAFHTMGLILRVILQ